MATTVPGEEAYYKDRYWNDHPFTLDYLCRGLRGCMGGNPLWWTVHFRDNVLSGRTLDRALIINCGNGWVDRDLFDLGVFKRGIGFDYSEKLLQEAREAAQGRDLHYICVDCNEVSFPENSFDLVVNVAAMHHVQYIDKLTRVIAKCLKPDGYFVNYDYVGPHRNQYGSTHWNLLEKINGLLPAEYRSFPLTRPDLQQMLRGDPTEAIHSELVLPMFERYFITLERKDLGGAIAYQLMYNNEALFRRCAGSDAAVSTLLSLDEIVAALSNLPAFASFFVGSPRKTIFSSANSALLERYTKEEEAREERARANGGLYDVAEPSPDLSFIRLGSLDSL